MKTEVLSSTGDILRKKMRPRLSAVGPCLAWWQAEADKLLREICKTTLGLDVKATGLEGRQVYAPEELIAMAEVSLPFLTTGPDGAMGLFVLDGPMIDGLIEQQLLGKVLPTERLKRPVTTIDAGLSEGFARTVLSRLTQAHVDQLAGFDPVGPQQDRASLRLSLGEGRYDIIQAAVDMGPGIKTGRFEIWVPSLSQGIGQLSTSKINPDMIALLAECEVELGSKIEGCTTTARVLMEMDAGTVLKFPKTALGSVALTDCKGQVIARGRLGQLNGERALRMSELGPAFGARAHKADAAPGLEAEMTPAFGGEMPDATAPMALAASPPIDLSEPDLGIGMGNEMAAMDIDLPAEGLPTIDLADQPDLSGGEDFPDLPETDLELPGDGFPAMNMAAMDLSGDEDPLA